MDNLPDRDPSPPEPEGWLYCDDHHCTHPADSHCPSCFDEWLQACNERAVERAIEAGEPYQHSDGW